MWENGPSVGRIATIVGHDICSSKAFGKFEGRRSAPPELERVRGTLEMYTILENKN